MHMLWDSTVELHTQAHRLNIDGLADNSHSKPLAVHTRAGFADWNGSVQEAASPEVQARRCSSAQLVCLSQTRMIMHEAPGKHGVASESCDTTLRSQMHG